MPGCAAARADEEPRPTRGTRQGHGGKTAPTVVLIVDDDDDIRMLLAEIVAGEGYAVVEAANGREGLAAARAEVPSLIILDLMMPVMDGWEFRERQRRDALLARIPVLAISAGMAPFERFGLEVDRFLPKPMDIGSLVSAVRELAGPACRESSALG